MLSGNVIDNMVLGGPASACGKLRKGDAIVAVDGKPFPPGAVAKALIGLDTPGSVVRVRVRRGIDEHEVKPEHRA